MKRRNKKGFTIVEVMLVISIIGFLAAIGIPAVLRAYANAQEAARQQNITAVEKAKSVLSLPAGVGIAGAMSLTQSDPFDEEVVSNLCLALRVNSLSDLTVGGVPIHVGDLTTKADYY